MKQVNSLNQEIFTDSENLEIAISELMEREEFVCTGDVCGAFACAVYEIA